MSAKHTELAELQENMLQSLIRPDEFPALDFADQQISAGKNLSPRECLAIYQRSYYNRLLECMRSQFKALAHCLGKDLFDDFARMYLKEQPSQHPSLAHLGDGFSAFLNEIRPDKEHPEKWIDFMIDVTRFESELYRIFDQPGSEGKRMANLETRDEHLEVQDCFFLGTYAFDVNRYYQQVSAGNDPEIPSEAPTFVVFIRKNYQVYIISITEMQFSLLQLIASSSTISLALEQFITKHQLIPSKVQERWSEWRADWIQKGFFIEK